MEVARCPASLRLCEGPRPWCCRACGRRHAQPAPLLEGGAGAEPPVPACTLCGLQLGPQAPPIMLMPPCTI